MKKIVPFFFLLPGCVSAAEYIVMLWTQSNGYVVDSTVDVPWSGKRITMSVPAMRGQAVKSDVKCSTSSMWGGWGGNTSWVSIPNYILIAGERQKIDVSATGDWFKHFESGGYSYWYKVKDRNNKNPDTDELVCGKPGDISKFPINVDYSGLTLSFDVPRGLPTGVVDASIFIGGGQEQQFWSEPNKSMYLPSEFVQNGIKNLEYHYSFNVMNSCTASAPSYEISYGVQSINSAEAAEKNIDIPITCTGPTAVNLKLLPLTQGDRENSVELGNGWEALISLNGKEQMADTIQYETAGSKSISVKSKLKSKNGKSAGDLSGTMLLVIQPV